jgi:putative transposase
MALGVSRSGYYDWQDLRENTRASEDRELSRRVREIFYKHRRRYGARRIAIEMTQGGHPCGVARVARLLKMQGLVAIQPKSFRPKTTQSRHKLGYSPNLILDRDEPTRVNELWVGDITYVPIRHVKFYYLAVLMDRYSRMIVGWTLGRDMGESLVLKVLSQAIRGRQPAPGLICHTDRGGQYAGKQYRAMLRRAGLLQSMSRADNCYDNAFMESCFGTLKTELEMTDYKDSYEARREINGYIAYYNHQRRHSSLNYLTPAQFEVAPRRRK